MSLLSDRLLVDMAEISRQSAEYLDIMSVEPDHEEQTSYMYNGKRQIIINSDLSLPLYLIVENGQTIGRYEQAF